MNTACVKWCNNNWGCSTDFEVRSISYDKDDKIHVSYNTRWEPNIEFINYLGIEFQKLYFELSYIEHEGCLAGNFNMLQGSVKSEVFPFFTIYFAKNDSDSL